MRSHRGSVEAPGTRRQHGHSSRTLAVATQVNYGRPSDGRSAASRSLFHSAGSALRASSLFIYMRPRRPLCRWKSTPGCHAADPAYYCITAAAGRPAGRACDERRQIAAGTRWINLLSISTVTSPRRRSRIVARPNNDTTTSSLFFAQQ